MGENEFLTTGDAARVLGVSADFIRQLTRDGRLPAQRTRSGQRLFTAADVEQLAKERAAKRRPHVDAAPA
jgi:excisionase family DNA binding protein